MPRAVSSVERPSRVAERADGLLGELARHGQRAGRERARARCSRARRSRRSRSAPCRRGRSRPAPATRPRCAARRAGRRPRRARRSSRRRRRPRRCRSSGCGSARREPRSSRLPAESDAPTSYSWLRETRPSSISDAFAVVPPMSNAIAFSWPSCRASDERRDDARGRARLERVDGPRGRVRGGHRAARRLQHRERRRDAGRVEPAAEVGDVAPHQRRDVGVDDRRRGALVLLLLAHDLARERDRDARAAPRAGSRRAAARARGGGARAAGRRRPTRRRPREPRRERAGLVLVERLDARCRRRSCARRSRSGRGAGRATAASSRSSRRGAACACAAARARRGSPRSSRARAARRGARAPRSWRRSSRARRSPTGAPAASSATAETTARS